MDDRLRRIIPISNDKSSMTRTAIATNFSNLSLDFNSCNSRWLSHLGVRAVSAQRGEVVA